MGRVTAVRIPPLEESNSPMVKAARSIEGVSIGSGGANDSAARVAARCPILSIDETRLMLLTRGE